MWGKKNLAAYSRELPIVSTEKLQIAEGPRGT